MYCIPKNLASSIFYFILLNFFRNKDIQRCFFVRWLNGKFPCELCHAICWNYKNSQPFFNLFMFFRIEIRNFYDWHRNFRIHFSQIYVGRLVVIHLIRNSLSFTLVRLESLTMVGHFGQNLNIISLFPFCFFLNKIVYFFIVIFKKEQKRSKRSW